MVINLLWNIMPDRIWLLRFLKISTLTLWHSTHPVNIGSQCWNHCNPTRVYSAIMHGDIAINAGIHENGESLRADIYGCVEC